MMGCIPAHCPLLSCPVTSPHSIQRQCSNTRTFRNRRATVTVRAEATPAATTAEDVALSPQAPASKSIISQENIMAALIGEGILLEDHYGRLQVKPEASTAEIYRAYQERCVEVQDQSLEETKLREQLDKLQDSFDLLTSEEERRFYDWSLLRKATHTVEYAWPYEADITQQLPDTPPLPVGPSFFKVKPEDEEGNRNVGLFFAGMLVLSFIINVAFIIGK